MVKGVMFEVMVKEIYLLEKDEQNSTPKPPSRFAFVTSGRGPPKVLAAAKVFSASQIATFISFFTEGIWQNLARKL